MAALPVEVAERTSEPKPAALPLVVDMDRCLVRADLATEALIAELEARAARFTRAIRGEPEGIDPAEIVEFALKGVDVSTLPLEESLVAYLRSCHAEGREIHLVTSASQTIADSVADRLGVFRSATGAGKGRGMSEADKLALISRLFPDGFAYAGHARSLMAAAESSVIAEADAAAGDHLRRSGRRIEAVFERKAATARSWLKAMRCHQWAKNGLLFVPLVLGHAFTDPSAILRCAIGFVLVGLLASGTYLLNDLVDLDADRRHPSKRSRPLARGDIDARSASIAASLLIVASLAASLAISPAFFATLAGYLVITLAYSLYLKRQMLIDVFVLACLFTSRIAMGIVLAGVAPSSWLLTFTMFFFLSLSLAKRHVEVVTAAERGIAEIPGRDYRASDLPLTVALGVACNAVAMLVLFLYLLHDAMPTGFYRQPYWLWGAAFVVFLWSLRIWGLAHRGRLDADPVAFAIKDPVSIALGAVVAGIYALSL